jgi:hypothetical protein
MEGEHAVAKRVSARLNAAAKGRKFGLTVGTAFLVLAAITLWRGAPRAPVGLAVLGGLLLLAALVVPASLERVERVWMGMAKVISRITTPVFMGIIYFGLFTPMGFVRRRFGRDRLAHRSLSGSLWADRPETARRSDLERQF